MHTAIRLCHPHKRFFFTRPGASGWAHSEAVYVRDRALPSRIGALVADTEASLPCDLPKDERVGIMTRNLYCLAASMQAAGIALKAREVPHESAEGLLHVLDGIDQNEPAAIAGRVAALARDLGLAWFPVGPMRRSC